MNKKTDPRIAILGWGSLIWDKRPEFDDKHGPWLDDGPVLKLEFSRISRSRENALTLVIDPEHGCDCTTAYAVSTRKDPDDAIADLRCREGTVMRHMGFYFANGAKTCMPSIPDTIAPWAEEKGFDVVVWTGLPGDFKDKRDEAFIEAALFHLQNLTPEGKALAATYVWRAPPLVQTTLREKLQSAPWFSPPAENQAE
ncbi:hypothetical protein F4V91_00630 [Neorhizobium galegae]|uniref:Uncharacterized protein n=1 Tax=Neorhizobium galegae TaxID=399 RepID=A0A6A1TLC0_NEOGA|nr:hypothetical protein [Neorhizobium galegae]KAB1085070.1 hypothetical protein F4V91_00630 [Neorhizobium galegae]